MAEEWIKAALALEYVSDGPHDHSAARRICQRAHNGLIAAKAERVIRKGQEERNKIIDKGFWWAEGGQALHQDWRAGDFWTWIDQSNKVRAFEVSFDFVELTRLVPAHQQASAMRRISVVGSDDWVTASDLWGLMSAKGGPFAAKLLEACQLGLIAGRAMRARRFKEREAGELDWSNFRAIEWDIPLDFWRNFATSSSAKLDWRLDKFAGLGGNEQRFESMELQGVHFHRSGLANLRLVDDSEASEDSIAGKRGRKPEYDWPNATAAIWGKIFRGELIPTNQADIEKAFQAFLAKGDKEPSESTVRPYAQPVWKEISKA